MAEYYAVLKKAVAGLHPNAHDARRSVYDKARAALVGQLKAINPPLSTSEISRQRLELEEAIRRVEREASQGYAAPAEPPRAAYEAQPAESYDEYEDEEDPAISEEAFAEDVFNQALEEIERQNAPEPEREPPPRQRRAAPPPSRRPEPPSQAYDYEPAPAYEPEPEPYGREPSLAPGYDGRPGGDYDRDRDRDRDLHWMEPSVGSRLRDDDRELIGRPARRSRLPMILLTVVMLAILGGVGAFAWAQRDVISEALAGLELPFLASSGGGSGDTAGSGTETAVKDNDRLLDGSAPANGGAGRSETTTATAVDPVTEPGGPAVDQPPVAQPAVLHEEALGGSTVETLDANVIWRYAESEANGPTIQASIEVPARSMKVRMIMRKNVDASLPASHLIEVFVDVPSNFPGGSVDSVKGLSLKPALEAQGRQLAAAAAKVAEGFFWIALSDDANAAAGNIALLREGNWFDMPLVYGNGQRVILAFEKGEPGRRVVEQALAAWGN